VKVFNFHHAELAADDDEPDGYRAPYAGIRPAIGAQRLGGNLVLLGTGESVCPYHYEFAEEEWLFVVEGTPTVRTPAGDEVLEAGDIVCFARGPDGAHKISNFAPQPARVIIISERADTAATVYEDSDKIGVFAPGTRLLFRRADAVDYWEGEGADGGQGAG
jgi:uncharacterized cupin superfamily protein